MRILRQFVVFIMMVPAGISAARAADAPAPHLEALIAELLANNPEVRASRAHGESLAAKVRQAGSLDDPMLMLKIQNGLINDPLNFSKEPMTAKVIGISQQLPWYGKRTLRTDAAREETMSSHEARKERTVELVREVKEIYYQIFFTDKSLEIVRKNAGILDTFVTLAETRYAVGQGAQQDIYKAQVERSKLLDMELILEQQRKSLAIRLNALLYRPHAAPVGNIPEFGLAPLPPSAEELLQLADRQRPLLRGLDARIRQGKADEALARREFYPDFNVFFEYMQRQPTPGNSGDDMYSLGVSFNLPFQRARRHARVAEAESDVTMATEELRDVRNTLAGEVADLRARMERLKRQTELYRTGIIPQATNALESATIGYQTGKSDFLNLLDSRVTLFNYQRDYYETMADYQISLARVEALVGATGSPTHGNGPAAPAAAHGEVQQ